ncbi:MAG: Wzz/FepE/Etk N-terminal domain-containing protein, partial [Usitatibacter sp.]
MKNDSQSMAVALAARTPLAELASNQMVADRLEQAFNLRDLMRIFLKRKWTILIIFAVFALFSIVRTYLAPPVYRASTTIQIEKFIPRVFDYKEVQPME